MRNTKLEMIHLTAHFIWKLQSSQINYLKGQWNWTFTDQKIRMKFKSQGTSRQVAPPNTSWALNKKPTQAWLDIGLIARFTSMKMDNMKMILLDNIICDTDSWYWYLMIVFFKSYVTVAKTIEVKYRCVVYRFYSLGPNLVLKRTLQGP